jgi:perosamine synthetase
MATMKQASAVRLEQVQLPSDQEASGRSFGAEELALLESVIETGCLTSTKGTMVHSLEERFAAMLGVRYAIACSSGSAAIHCAVAAINPEPGDEIITSPITDMGAITPILYQGAIPVFADVDPRTCNLTAATIEACVSDRTRAIIVTHLFGNPADMEAIMAVARERQVPVIEDCAQAYLARSDGKFVGSIGEIGCFSLQQGKHISTGEGGIVVTNDDALARRIRLFVNKAWGYGDPTPDHYFLALNYRMTELQGAVALAQLGKLERCVQHRRAMARRLTDQVSTLPGLSTPWSSDHAEHSYWRYCLWIDDRVCAGGSPALGAELKKWHIAAAPRYIQKPAFQCELFRDQRTFGNSRFPFTLARPETVDYAPERFPGVFEGLREILVLPWNEGFSNAHVDYIAAAIRESHNSLSGGVVS